MKKTAFYKKPTSYEEQLNLLLKRGLVIEDRDKVIRYLKQISYYRLSAYFLPFQKEKNIFNAGTSFENILEVYKFDRKLRLLVFDNIERVEITIRAQISHILANKYNNSHWQDNKDIFKKPYKTHQKVLINPYEEFQSIIKKNTASKKPEVFISHYIRKYSSPKNPPAWMCMELLTIGELSRLFNGLKLPEDKQLIANFFGLPHPVLTSWLHSLTYVRNLCAHHSRLWNRDLAIRPDILKKPRLPWISKFYENNRRTFYFLCIVKYLLIASNPNNHFTRKLTDLFLKYPGVPFRYLGFPTNDKGDILNWYNEPLWK